MAVRTRRAKAGEGRPRQVSQGRQAKSGKLRQAGCPMQDDLFRQAIHARQRQARRPRRGGRKSKAGMQADRPRQAVQGR